MGRDESCTGLSVSQPGQGQRDSKGQNVEDRTVPPTSPDDLGTVEKHNTSITEHNRSITETSPPPRLWAVMKAWDELPEAVKEGIVAIVLASIGHL